MSAQCKALKASHMRVYRCTRRATGADGLCSHCRNTLTPSPTYRCTACGTTVRRGVDSPLCAEHNGPP